MKNIGFYVVFMCNIFIDGNVEINYTLNIKLFEVLSNVGGIMTEAKNVTKNVINQLLVDVFNDILTVEENAFKDGQFHDVSITEVHTVEAIGMYEPKSMSEIAKKLKITVGTLTVAINNLVKKGYVERYKTENDRRVVKIGLTKKGRLLFRVHSQFHSVMVNSCVEDLTLEENEILGRSLGKLHTFLKEKYNLID